MGLRQKAYIIDLSTLGRQNVVQATISQYEKIIAFAHLLNRTYCNDEHAEVYYEDSNFYSRMSMPGQLCQWQTALCQWDSRNVRQGQCNDSPEIGTSIRLLLPNSLRTGSSVMKLCVRHFKLCLKWLTSAWYYLFSVSTVKYVHGPIWTSAHTGLLFSTRRLVSFPAGQNTELIQILGPTLEWR